MDRDALSRLRQLAGQQSGLFSTRQAAAHGVALGTLQHWDHQGWVRPARRGVYVFSGSPPSRWEPTVAAALAAGEQAVLSHRTAAAVHGFHGVALPAVPELTLPRRTAHRLEGVQVHLTGPVDEADRVLRRGVAVTSPPRTLVDLAAYLSPTLLGSILDEGAVQRQWTFEQVSRCLATQSRRRTGGPTLRRLLSVRLGEAAPDSPLEQQIIRYLWPLGPFEVHHQLVLDGMVIILDVAWPWWQVAAEIDGRSFRQTSRSTHDRESRKLTLLTAANWRVAHLTATMTAAECIGAVTSLLPPDFNGAPSRRAAADALGVSRSAPSRTSGGGRLRGGRTRG